MTTDAEIAPLPFPGCHEKAGPGRPRATPENPQQRIERLQVELRQAHEAAKAWQSEDRQQLLGLSSFTTRTPMRILSSAAAILRAGSQSQSRSRRCRRFAE